MGYIRRLGPWRLLGVVAAAGANARDSRSGEKVESVLSDAQSETSGCGLTGSYGGRTVHDANGWRDLAIEDLCYCI
jgi:hypothetical protein